MAPLSGATGLAPSAAISGTRQGGQNQPQPHQLSQQVQARGTGSSHLLFRLAASQGLVFLHEAQERPFLQEFAEPPFAHPRCHQRGGTGGVGNSRFGSRAGCGSPRARGYLSAERATCSCAVPAPSHAFPAAAARGRCAPAALLP